MSVMSGMMDVVKKSLAFGLGAAAFSAEKVKQFVDEMVERGEMTSEEGKKFMDDVSARADEEKNKMQEWMREQMSKMMKQAGAAEAAKVSELEMRIAQLEMKVAQLSGGAVETAQSESGVPFEPCEECGE